VSKLALALTAVTTACLPAGCSERTPAVPPEPWVAGPVAEWPDFDLTNVVVFTDTTYDGLANAFLVDTGKDTLAATCKHIFMVFANQRGLTSIDPGEQFVSWSLRSGASPERVLPTRGIINLDATERIGDFQGIRDRDWLILELAGWNDGLYPLKVRFTPLASGELIYAVGRSLSQRAAPEPAVSRLRVVRAASSYYYVEPLDPAVDPQHTSGSPVIDGNGYLVGLVSGATGRLGVIAGTGYLRQLLDRYGIPYGL